MPTRYRVSTEELRARLAKLDADYWAAWGPPAPGVIRSDAPPTWHQRQYRRRAWRDYRRRRCSLVRRIRARGETVE